MVATKNGAFYPLDLNDCAPFATCTGNVNQDPDFPPPSYVNPDPSFWQ